MGVGHLGVFLLHDLLLKSQHVLMMADNVSWLSEAISLLGRDVDNGFFACHSWHLPLLTRVFFFLFTFPWQAGGERNIFHTRQAGIRWITFFGNCITSERHMVAVEIIVTAVSTGFLFYLR